MGPLDILKLIPHRHPFLLVDRIVEMESDSSGIKSGIGIKNVSANEPYLAGQADPVMPPLLLLEGIAQTAAALLCISSCSRRAATDLFHGHRQGSVSAPDKTRGSHSLSCQENSESRSRLALSRAGNC